MLNLLRPCRAAIARYLLPLTLLVAAAVPSHSQILNKNLVVNGDAEAASTPQSWTTTGNLSVANYGDENRIPTGAFGPVNRGTRYFMGGHGDETVNSTAVQTIDLSGAATEIDLGRVKYYFSGWIGMAGGTTDNIASTNLKAEFQDANGTVLFTSTVPGPTQADLNAPEGLFPNEMTGFLPAKVRKVKVTLDLGNPSQTGNVFDADNIALVLTTDAMFGVNLLVNGDAETDTGVPAADQLNAYIRPVPGWNGQSKEFYVARYGDYQEPLATDYHDSGSTSPGKYFFGCNGDFRDCTLWQSIDFTTASKLVDAGSVTFSMAAWLGGDTNSLDDASVSVTFLDASGHAVVSPTTIGPVTEADRQGLIGLWPRSVSGNVPDGARSARVELVFHKRGPSTDNLTAYADSISLVLDAIQITQVPNAASFVAGAVAPGEFVAIQGSGLGPATGMLAVGSQKGLAGTKVTFNGIEAFLTYSSYGQVNAIVPYGVGNKADVVVTYGGKTSAVFPLATADSAPGIFTQQYGPGQLWAVNDTYTFNSPTTGTCAFSPAYNCTAVARGGWFEFWATGQGLVTPDGQDGEIIDANAPKNLKLPWKVTIGGIEAEKIYALLIYTGEIQVAVKVPANAPTGNVPVVLTIGNNSSRSDATIAIK